MASQEEDNTMGFAAGVNAGANLRSQRDSKRALKEQRDQELLKTGYSFEDGQMHTRPDSLAEAEQLAIKESVQLAKSLQGKLAAQATDGAFEDFAHTGDANFLQKALNDDPVLKNAWAERGVQMVGNLDFDSDANLLAKSGFVPTQYDTDEKKNTLKRNVYKVFNGKEWGIGLANNAVAETGAMRRLGSRKGEVLNNNYKDFVSLMTGPKGSANTSEGHKYEQLINDAAEKYDLPPNLIAAQIQQESGGKTDAVSSKGAGGLMQIMPATAKDLGVTDVHDPAQNIEGGAKYMRQMLDRYDGDVTKALAAYNAGPGNVDKYNGIPPFGETQQYVQKVMKNFDNGEKYYGRTADGTAETILEHRRAIANAAKGTTSANVDRAIAQKDKQLEQEDINLALKAETNRIKLRTEGTTTTQKDLAAADKVSNVLMESFGGEAKFFEAKLETGTPEYNKAFNEMVKVEQLTGTEPSEADKVAMNDLRTLISLSKPIEKLTSAETGVIDKNLGDLKKYLSDDVKGVEAKAAWSAFRNAYLFMISGKAVTPQEAKRQEQAFGKLGNKLGPALQMFSVAVAQAEARLDSVSRNMLPISAKVRLGVDTQKLRSTQDNIQKELRRIQGISEPVEPVQNRKSLDDIFKDR